MPLAAQSLELPGGVILAGNHDERHALGAVAFPRLPSPVGRVSVGCRGTGAHSNGGVRVQFQFGSDLVRALGRALG
jgi:hypothetical protein